MSSTPGNQDPALASQSPTTAPSTSTPATDPAAPPHLLDSAQIVQLLRHFPSVYQVRPILLTLPPLPSFLLRDRSVSCICVYELGQAASHIRSSACLHVIRGEVTAEARSRVGQVPKGLLSLSIRPGSCLCVDYRYPGRWASFCGHHKCDRLPYCLLSGVGIVPHLSCSGPLGRGAHTESLGAFF
jgi:hypothetical protein